MLELTFICYASFHASRKPLSIVKSSLIGGADADGAHDGLPGFWWLDGYQAAYHSGLVARLVNTGTAHAPFKQGLCHSIWLTSPAAIP